MEDVEGVYFNPVSDDYIRQYINQTAEFIDIIPSLRDNVEKAKRVLDIKDPNERLKVMDTIQGERQALTDASDLHDVLGVTAEYYPEVQQSLQEKLNAMAPEDRKKVSDELNKLGWGVRNGVVLGGNYKYRADNNALREVLSPYYSKYADAFNKADRIKIKDNKYDRRFEKLHTFDFNSVVERDEWAKNQGFIKKGKYYVDPKNPNNIIKTRVFRDKKVDKGVWDEWNKKKRDFDDYTLENADEGIYERYITDTPSEKGVKKEGNSGISPYESKEKRSQSPFPMLLPQYNRIPPVLFQPGLRQIGHYQSNPNKVTSEEAVRALQGNYNHASKTAYESNPYTAGAFLSNAFAQTNDAIVKADSQAAMFNAQDRRQVEDANESRMLQRDMTNLQLKDQYENKANAAMDNYVKSWRNYFDVQNEQNVNNFNTTNQRNMLNAVNQDLEIDAFGRIRQIGDPEFNVGIHLGKDGKYYQKDPKTGQKREVQITHKDGDTTTKTTTKGKVGGRILKTGIKSYLK